MADLRQRSEQEKVLDRIYRINKIYACGKEQQDRKEKTKKGLDRINRINRILLAGEKPDKKQYRKKF